MVFQIFIRCEFESVMLENGQLSYTKGLPTQNRQTFPDHGLNGRLSTLLFGAEQFLDVEGHTIDEY